MFATKQVHENRFTPASCDLFQRVLMPQVSIEMKQVPDNEIEFNALATLN